VPTIVTKIVDPDNGAGTDYTSLSAWEAGENGDLTGVRDEIAVASCRSSSGGDDVGGQCTIDGWTTSPTQYILITCTGTNRHQGVYDAALFHAAGTGNPITCTENYLRVDGMQITPTTFGIYETHGGGDCGACDWRISNNIILGGVRGISFSGDNENASQVYYVWNNIIYDFSDSGDIGIRCGGTANYVRKLYNNTLQNCATGITQSYGTVIAVNTLFSGNAADASGTFAAGTDYNVTSRASIGYTVTGGGNSHDHTEHTFTFVDADGDDFHLASNDTGAIDFGVSDPGSGLFSTDIDGSTRSGTWDVGADEYVAAAAGQPTIKRWGGVPGMAINRGVW
jgi:hypothetical protein